MFAFNKQDLHAMYGEFIGTTLFLLIGMAGVQATVTNLSVDNATDGTSIRGSDAARLLVSLSERGSRRPSEASYDDSRGFTISQRPSVFRYSPLQAFSTDSQA